jgi:C-terminal processing protease CtpA/Prc
MPQQCGQKGIALRIHATPARWITLVLLALGLAVVAARPLPVVFGKDNGPLRVQGTGRYTAANFLSLMTRPVVALVDAGGRYVLRDPAATAAYDAQLFGRLLSPITRSPYRYEIELPANPQGRLVDAAHTGDPHAGVQIWSAHLFDDMTDQPRPNTLTPLEQVATGALNQSIELREPPTAHTAGDIIRGALLVFAPTAGRGFPAAAGADGRLFTADDPIATLPQGWTLAKIGAGQVTFDRSPVANVPLFESAADAQLSLRGRGMIDGFDAFIALMQQQYAYNAERHIDWPAWRAEFLPRVQTAAARNDWAAYWPVFYELAARIKDTHVKARAVDADALLFKHMDFIQIGLNNNAVQLDDGRVFVVAWSPGSWAARAGLTPMTEIVRVDGQPVARALAQRTAQQPYGTPALRLQHALAFEMRPSQVLQLTVRLPTGEITTVSAVAPAFESWQGVATMQRANAGEASFSGSSPDPVNSRVIRAASQRSYGYLSWPAFLQANVRLPLIERQLQHMQDTAGLVIDLRGNAGGSMAMTYQVLSYFFAAGQPFTNDRYAEYRFDPARNAWVERAVFRVPAALPLFAPSPAGAYTKPVVILVDAACASSCEFFSKFMQDSGRAVVIGADAQTAGAGGATREIFLPRQRDPRTGRWSSGQFSMTYTRNVYRDTGKPYIEGIGVTPDVRVPKDSHYALALARGDDPVLQSALAWLNSQ